MKQLPARKKADVQFEVLDPAPRRESNLTERQMDEVIKASGQVARDVGEIAKGLVNIAHIRASGKVEVEKIEAQTRQIEVATRAEIDRIIASKGKIHTRAEAAQKILGELKEMFQRIDDPAIQGRLIDSLSSILTVVISEEKR